MTSTDRVVPLPRRVPVAEVQGTLALDLQPRQAPPARRVQDATPTAPATSTAPTDADVVPIDRALRREVEGWVSRFTQAVVEIVGGDRPLAQLLRWTSAEVYADLERRAQLVGRAGHHQPGHARVQPVHPRVVSVHSFFVTPGVVESSVHVRYGARSRAVAARFELHGDRWVCTVLQFA